MCFQYQYRMNKVGLRKISKYEHGRRNLVNKVP